jgi:hypothetical protein
MSRRANRSEPSARIETAITHEGVRKAFTAETAENALAEGMGTRRVTPYC